MLGGVSRLRLRNGDLGGKERLPLSCAFAFVMLKLKPNLICIASNILACNAIDKIRSRKREPCCRGILCRAQGMQQLLREFHVPCPLEQLWSVSLAPLFHAVHCCYSSSNNAVERI